MGPDFSLSSLLRIAAVAALIPPSPAAAQVDPDLRLLFCPGPGQMPSNSPVVGKHAEAVAIAAQRAGFTMVCVLPDDAHESQCVGRAWSNRRIFIMQENGIATGSRCG